MEHGRETGDAGLDVLLHDHVGLVDPGLEPAPGGVVDLNHQGGSPEAGGVGGQGGEGAPGRGPERGAVVVGEVARIVDGLLGLGAQVGHLVAALPQVLDHRLLQAEAGVVGGDDDPGHAVPMRARGWRRAGAAAGAPR